MVPAPNPTLARRRLAAKLVRLRGNAPRQSVRKALEWSESKLSRIEHGLVGLSGTDLQALFRHYRFPAEQWDPWLELRRQSQKPGHWAEYRDVLPDSALRLLETVDGASRLQIVSPMIAPELLQTPEYAGMLIERVGYHREPDASVERLLSLQVERQKLITRDHPAELHAVILESGLLRMTSGPQPGISARQLYQMISLGERGNVTIQVLPLNDEKTAMESNDREGYFSDFTVVEFADELDPPAYYTDTSLRIGPQIPGFAALTDDPVKVADRKDRFEVISEAALPPEDSLAVLNTAWTRAAQRVAGLAPPSLTGPDTPRLVNPARRPGPRRGAPGR